MGTTAALKELETNEIFCEDKIEGPCGPVKGIYARERTFLALKAERLLIRTLVDTLDGEADAKKLGLACKRSVKIDVFWMFCFFYSQNLGPS